MVSLNDSCLDICDPVQTGSEPLVPLVRSRFEPESGSDRVRTGLNQRFEPVRTGAGLNQVRTGWNPWFEPVRTGFMWFHLTTSAWTFVIRFKPVQNLWFHWFEAGSNPNRVRTGFGPGSDRFEPKVRTGSNRCRFEPGSNRLEPVVRTGSNRVYVISLNDFCLDICDSVQTGSNRFRTFGSIGSNPVRTRIGFGPGSDRSEPKVPAGSNPVQV